MKLKVDISILLLVLIIIASGGAGFAGGIFTPARNTIENQTIVQNNYNAAVSASASASVAVGYAQTNVDVELDFEITNLILSLSNVTTNSVTNSYGYFVTNEIYKTNKE